MCIFTWDRWSCGHFVKTQIQYCSYARDLPPKQRETTTRCHKPSISPEFSNHVEEPCDICFRDDDRRWTEAVLPFITLRSEKIPACPKQLNIKHQKDANLTQLALQNLGISMDISRQELSQLYSKYRDIASTAISTLTRNLLDAEDEYRRIGSRYYADRDEPVGPPPHWTYDPESRLELEDALHGNDPYRTRVFFQPFRHLEESIRKALHFLATHEPRRAYQECLSAYPHIQTILSELAKLESHVNKIGSYREYVFLFRTNGRYRDDDKTHEAIRDEAM